jgi:hypothetical protein
MEKTKGTTLFVMLLLAAAGFSIFALSSPSDGAKDNNEHSIVFSVNGSPVSTDEFSIVLENNKALTTSYFDAKYQTEYTADFWTTDFQGEKPIDYAKQKSVEELTRYRVEQQLIMEQGENVEIDYSQFIKKLENENLERRNKKLKNVPVYGLTQFSPFQYYDYLHSTHFTNMMHKLISNSDIDNKSLLEFYDNHKDKYFNKGTLYRGEIIQDGSVIETVTLEYQYISKEDQQQIRLYSLAETLKPGELSEPIAYRQGQSQFKLTQAEFLGYRSFDDVQSELKQLYIQDTIQKQIEIRIKSANVILNLPVYDAIQMN